MVPKTKRENRVLSSTHVVSMKTLDGHGTVRCPLRRLKLHYNGRPPLSITWHRPTVNAASYSLAPQRV